MVELDGQEWIKLLSQEHHPSKEHLVFQTRFRKTLRIRKHEWNHYFADWKGLGLKAGNQIELAGIQEAIPAPAKEQSTFLILKALQQFGYLDLLLPDRRSPAANRIGI